MNRPFDQGHEAPDDEPNYVPSPAMLDLIRAIAEEPELDSRFWCGATMAINMDILRPTRDAEDLVLDIVGNALESGFATHEEFELTYDERGMVVDVAFDDGFGDEPAELVLSIMKLHDVNARRVALEALIVPYARSDHEGGAIAQAAIRAFIGRVEDESCTCH